MENMENCSLRAESGTAYGEAQALHDEAARALSSNNLDRLDPGSKNKVGDLVDEYMDMLYHRLGLNEPPYRAGTPFEESTGDRTPDLNRDSRVFENAETVALENKLSSSLSGLSDADKKQFQSNMHAFLERAHKQGLDEESEVNATLKSCDSLLNPDARQLFLDGLFGQDKGRQLRTMLAGEIMSEAAYPSNTDQGAFGTCPAASMETRTWFDHPAVAAKIIADEALTGQWVAKDGNVVKLPEIDFSPDRFSKDASPKDGMRSYAGQLFQATLLSDVGTRQSTPKYYVTGGIDKDRYGEWKGVEYWGNAAGKKVEEYEGLNDGPIAQELARLNGNNTEVLSSDTSSAHTADNVVIFKGVDDLRQKLQEAEESGKMPVIIAVAGNDKFFDESNAAIRGQANLPGEYNPRKGLRPSHALNHVICIDKYDPDTDTVVVDNQWGSVYDWGTKSVMGTPIDKHSAARLEDFFPATQGQEGVNNSLRL